MRRRGRGAVIHPRSEYALYYCGPNAFFCTFACPARGSSLALSAAGQTGASACTPRRKCASLPRSVARALGRSKSRDLASDHGIASRLAEPRRTMETPQNSIFPRLTLLFHTCITPSPELSSSLLCGSHGTTAVAHQALPFCDGHGRCIRVCACASHVSC